MYRGVRIAIGTLGAVVTACADPVSSVAIDPSAAVVSVTPSNAAVDVNPGKAIVVTFNRRMMTGMEMRAVLHEGSVTGANVAGSYAWSSDRTTLTFTPSSALKARTGYALHLAPDMRVDSGERLNHAGCTSLGARNVTQGMMGGGMMSGGAMGPGMMGSGWSAMGGSYGMVFTFTTA